MTPSAVSPALSSLGMSPYVYNSSNELTSTPAATFAYDSNGNTLTKTDSSGTTTYNWDFENRLSSVVLPSSGGTVTFKYDPLGRRIQKSAPSGTINYIYDGADSVQEVDSAGALLAHYTQGYGIDDPLAETRGATNGYYDQDGLGSVTALSNSTAAIADSYAYDSFGDTIGSTGALTNPFQYTGRDYDQETGFHYYRARYYDASVGRFISEDPIRFKGGINFYDYVQNNPISASDPFGLQTLPLPPRMCGSVEMWECSVKCGGWDNVESCEVNRFRMPYRRYPNGFVLWKIFDGATKCECKGQHNRSPNLQPQCVKVPGSDPKAVQDFITSMKVMGLIGIGAAVISQPELWPVAVGVGGKLAPALAH